MQKYLWTAFITQHCRTLDDIQLGGGVLRISALALFAWVFGEFHPRLQQDKGAINHSRVVVTISQTTIDLKKVNSLQNVIPTVYSVLFKTQTPLGTI